MKPGWGPALRIARRDARRSRGRSLLIIAMVALPVFGATTIDLLSRSMQLDPSESAARTVGHADAQLTWQGTPVQQANFSGWKGIDNPIRQQTPLVDLLPAGSRVVALSTGQQLLTTRAGRAAFKTTELAYDDPLFAGLVHQLTGRAPQAPGEIVATTAALDHLGVHVGDRVHDPDGGGSWLVVGTVRRDSETRDEMLIGRPGTFGKGSTIAWYIDVPGPLSWPVLEKLNAAGYLATAGYPVAGAQGPKDIQPSTSNGPGAIAAVTIAVVLVLLEVALMAGAAFAVGLRRQARQLAVLAATGADARVVRRVVLAGGVVLGVAGALVGAVTGILASLAILAWLGSHASSVPGHVDMRAVELVGATLFGVLAGVLAAVLPARTAGRQDVVAALTGRRAEGHPRARVPIVGTAMVVIGVGLTAYGARSLTSQYAVVLVGLILTQLGFVVCAPSLLGLVARLGRFLPTVPRIAVRDLARHRSRSGAAVAAVLVAVAGSIAVGVVANSKEAESRAIYAPYMPKDVVYVDTTQGDPGVGAGDPQAVGSISRMLASALPGSTVAALGTGRCNDASCGETNIIRQDGGSDCPVGERGGFCIRQHNLLTGDLAALRAVLGRVDPAVESAYAAGTVLVFDPIFYKDATVHLIGMPAAGGGSGTAVRAHPKESNLPAMLVTLPRDGRVAAAVAFLPPAAATTMGMSTVPTLVVARTSSPVSTATLDAAQASLADAGIRARIGRETGYDGSVATLLLVLLLASSVVTIGGVAVATGLAAADGRDDVATLAAVGASPRVRRLLVGWQAGGVGLVGATVGIVAGVIPAYALLRAQGRTAMVVPWPTLLVTALAVPLVASVLCGAVVRNQLPIERRTV
jgi:putative ABC transport system permease protein